MGPADQIESVVRQSVRDADAACLSYRDALARQRGPGSLEHAGRRTTRDELIAAAERDGAVMPRVLMSAESADASPHGPMRAPAQESAEPERPQLRETPPEPPGFQAGWLTVR